MKDLLFNLLHGPLSEMGVSDADLTKYIGDCIGYVYAMLAVLVIAIVVIVVASLMAKKGFKLPINLTACVACVLALLIIVNMVCFGPMKDVLETQLAPGINLSDSTVAASKEVVAKVGDEGLVLVKNDNNLLPLSSDVKALNVFGWGSAFPIFGGTGSGVSDGSSAVGVLKSLEDAGYKTNEELTKLYTDYTPEGRPTIAMGTQDWTLPEPTVDVYTDSVMSNAKSHSDVAVIVLSRSGGEGADLPRDMYAVIHGTYDVAGQMMPGQGTKYGYSNATYKNNGSYDDFEQGEHYLEPSVTEENMIAKVCSEFSKVILVVNANNAMELGWVADYPQIGAVILAPGTGATGMSALGKIINGSLNPSGKTVDTYVYDLTATPTWNNVGNFGYTNVDDLRLTIAQNDAAFEGNIAFVNYVEGIYNGYKFYETAHDVGMAGFSYDKEVLYPFGYGLSYTTFKQEIKNFDANGDVVKFDVEVTNTGSVAGKDVVEVYFTPPYTNGGIEKASVNLIDFGKTGLLEGGKSEIIHFEIPKEEFASYDDGLKISGGGYILEAGDYTVSIRSDSHTVLASETFNVASDVNYSSGRASDLVPAVNQFQDYSRGDFVQLSRKGNFANYAQATAAPSSDAYVMSAKVRAEVEEDAFGFYDPTKYDNAGDTAPTLGANNGKTLYDLRGKDIDDPAWEPLLDQLSFDDMSLMINLGSWRTAAIESVGKVATTDCDGPAGLSNFLTQSYGTAYPTEVLMAQTWNTALIEEMGAAMGQEYADANNYGWYGPAMNNHRNAFAGRNFEYYSEDGVLAGKLASAEINGASTKGVYPYIKHFAVNDQEWNRCSFLLTFASEQAIREIYLKPFEICVKNYDIAGHKPLAVMSSFNWIGTEPSCGNEHLLINVLREEWGFVGMVETDFDGSYGYMISDHCVRSGNDLMLSFNGADSNRFTDKSATALLAMRQSCKNIMYTVVNSGYYAEGDAFVPVDYVGSFFLPINIGVGVVLALVEAAAVYLFLKKFKAA